MIFQLVVRKKPESGSLQLGFGALGRVLFAVIAAFMLGGLLLVGEMAIVSLVIGLICLVAAVYNESWYFDRSSQRFVHEKRFGISLGRKEYRMEQLNRVLLRVVSGPGPIDEEDFMKKEQPHIPKALRKGRAVLLLDLSVDGLARRVVLDDRSHRDADSLEGLGNAIAGYCGVPFERGRHQYT